MGQAVGFVAWRMTLVAVPVEVYRLTGSALDVGLVALTQFVPLITLTIVGGAIADTVDRRRLLIVSSVGVALGTAGYLANALFAQPRAWAIFAVSVVQWSLYALGAGAARRARSPRVSCRPSRSRRPRR
jgi:MFS family permease